MGVVIKNEVAEDCLLGVWEITETYDELLEGLKLHEDEMKRLENFGNPARKLEFLSVRKLLKNLIGRDERIMYGENKKPYLEHNSYQISISHSFHLTSILLSKKNRVGIDLEYMSHRIRTIAHKFMNESEYITDDPNLKRYHLYIHWCAKEALYKICDKQDINFKQNLSILPFEPLNKGILTGIVSNKFGTEEFRLDYFRREDYVVVWCEKEKTSLDKMFNFTPSESQTFKNYNLQK